MSIPKNCDVAIIGGGPAGSTAGVLLSQQGYDVVLFDKDKHPRYNVGESIIPHFWKYADLVGAGEQMRAEGFITKAGGTAVWNGTIRQMAFKDFGYQQPALHVERDRFDYILLENAKAKGVRVFEEVTALQADLNGGEAVKITYRTPTEKTPAEIACRYVVDASGQGAVIAKQLGIRRIDDSFRFMSVWGYFKNSKYVAANGKAYAFANYKTIPPTTFISNIEGWGWLWHITLRESTSIGLVLPQEQMRQIKTSHEALETYFVRKCREIPVLNRLLEDAEYCEGSFHVIRDYSYLPVQVAGPGFFLVGDAAAFVDPIFSVGVTIGMYAASAASWAIDRCFKTPVRAAAHQEMYATQYMNRLELSRSLSLPRYGVGQAASTRATAAIAAETSIEQELISVASSMTTRNENFQELVEGTEARHIKSNKLRLLEAIEF